MIKPNVMWINTIKGDRAATKDYFHYLLMCKICSINWKFNSSSVYNVKKWKINKIMNSLWHKMKKSCKSVGEKLDFR